ncbi:MAG: hypothetical protein ACI9J2_002344 [Saprospiraceae bacterium]|jgi:hypothetical protein
MALLASSLSIAAPFKIAFISDGADEAVRVQNLIIDELSPLLGESAGLEFVNIVSTPSPEAFEQQFEFANANQDIEAIIAPGFLGSQFIYNLTQFDKPTFLSWIVDPNLMGSELKADTNNLHWLSTRNDVESTFATIAQVIGPKPVTLLVDEGGANLGQAFFDGLKVNAQKFGLTLSVTVLDPARPTIA